MKKNEIVVDGKVVNENAFQDVCRAYVGRYIGNCVSSLMYDVGQNLEQCAKIFDFDYDEATGWFQRQDFEQAVLDWLDDCDDVSELEDTANKVGYWDDVVAAVKEKLGDKLVKRFYIEFIEDGDDNTEEVSAINVEEAERKFYEDYLLDDVSITDVTEGEFNDDDEWIDAQKELGDKDMDVLDMIRDEIKGLGFSEDELREIADENNIEPDYDEVYEHWTIEERWFANELKARGQVIFEFGGMTIWGRMTTGQSIMLDGVIRAMVKDLDDDHYIWGEAR